jgi:hypothetical protein
MIYRGRERRSRRRVVLKAYLRAQRNSARAAALEREQDMLRAAAGHAGVVALERVLEVRATRAARARLRLCRIVPAAAVCIIANSQRRPGGNAGAAVWG